MSMQCLFHFTDVFRLIDKQEEMLGSFYFIKHLLTYRGSQSCQDLVLDVFTRLISMLSFNHIFLSVDTTTIKKKVYVKLQYGKVSISHLCSGSVQI